MKNNLMFDFNRDIVIIEKYREVLFKLMALN
jgi:hypothetical protein